MNIENQLLRMTDLANYPARLEKTVIDKKSGHKIHTTPKAAKRGIIGFSAKHIYQLIAQEKFPKPIKIGRASLWRLSDINAWIEQQGEQNEN